MVGLSAAAAALLTKLIAAAAGTAALGGVTQLGGSKVSDQRKTSFKNDLRDRFPNISESAIDALWSQYGDKSFNLFDFSTWGNQTDKTGLNRELQRIQDAYSTLGDMPDYLTEQDIADIEAKAANEIDAENREIFDLYDQTLSRSTDLLQDQLAENTAMFNDYRNQILSNNAMETQALAGSTRYELDRQQRNAITRGASAAQRLVSNINAQLGTQAQSAQNALNTSNALASQLLTQRQAQAGLRSDYADTLNDYDTKKASQLNGLAERKSSYQQSQVGYAKDKNEYARDQWNNAVSDYFNGDSTGEGIYRSQYGTKYSNGL